MPKISVFIFLLELVHYTSQPMLEFNLTNLLIFSSLLSLIIGTVVGLVQRRIKRVLAYSSISHVGFMLLALAGGSQESISAFIFYLMQYSVSNINIFFIIVSIGYSLPRMGWVLEINNSPLQFIKQLKGYFHLNPVLSLSFAITICSFMGIPPLVGFFAKQMVLSAALSNGYVFLTFVGVLTSVVGAAYYLRILKEIFFEKPVHSNLVSSNFANSATGSLTITISVLTLVILLFMLEPAP